MKTSITNKQTPQLQYKKAIRHCDKVKNRDISFDDLITIAAVRINK